MEPAKAFMGISLPEYVLTMLKDIFATQMDLLHYDIATSMHDRRGPMLLPIRPSPPPTRVYGAPDLSRNALDHYVRQLLLKSILVMKMQADELCENASKASDEAHRQELRTLEDVHERQLESCKSYHEQALSHAIAVGKMKEGQLQQLRRELQWLETQRRDVQRLETQRQARNGRLRERRLRERQLRSHTTRSEASDSSIEIVESTGIERGLMCSTTVEQDKEGVRRSTRLASNALESLFNIYVPREYSL